MENYDNSRITYIYGLYEVGKENEIRYVGKTLNLKERLSSHIKKNKSNKEKSEWIKSVINNDGEIKMKILEKCLHNWSEREIYWINYYGLDNLTNRNHGGQNGKSYDITFEEFKDWVRNNLPNIKTIKEWKYCILSGIIPDNIPKCPPKVYPEMKNWGEIFGTGRVHNIELTKNYLSYNYAKEYVKEFNFKSIEDWKNRFNEIDSTLLPKKPNRFYQKRGWLGWGDFLNTGNIRNCDKIFVSYDECKIFTKENNIKSQKEWFSFKNKPNNIPSSPSTAYKEWISWMDFFDRVEKNIKFEYLSYKDASYLLISNNIRNYTDFRKFINNKTKIYKIPAKPDLYYKDEWISWYDFLDYKPKKRCRNNVYYSYGDAKKWTICNNIKTSIEFKKLSKSNDFPIYIPKKPDLYYKDEWINWYEWLGK